MSKGKRIGLGCVLCLLLGLAAALGGCGGPATPAQKIAAQLQSATVVYDGNEHRLTATDLPAGVSAVYEPAQGFTDAGSYTVTATLSGDGYETLVLTATLTITRASNVWLSEPDCEEIVYDGETALAPSATARFGTPVFAYSEDGTDWTDSAPTDAGIWTIRARVAETANYPALESTFTARIAPRRIEIPTIETLTYNGTEQTALHETADYTVAGGSATAAGDYTARAALRDPRNTCWTDDTVEELSLAYTVAKAAAVITIEDRTFRYDGTAHELTATLNHTESELIFTGNGVTEAGVHTVTIAAPASANYLAVSRTATLTITRATHTVVFRQSGRADVVREVLDLAALEDVPEPFQTPGYEVSWAAADLECVRGDLIVTAEATPIRYEIEYVLDGGDRGDNPLYYTVEQSVELLPPTKFANTFLGWFADAEYRTAAERIATGTTGKQVFYARWLPLAYEQAVVYQGAAGNLTDGDDTTFLWLDRSAGDDTALLFDLGAPTSVRDIRVLTGKPDGGDAWKGGVALSADGSTFLPVGEIAGSAPQLFNLSAAPMSARYLRLTLDPEWVGSTNWLAVREIGVNTQSSYVSFQNIALEPSVDTSPAAITDGDWGTYAWFGAPSAAAGGESTLTLDLTEIRDVVSVQLLMAKKDSIEDYLKQVRLEYSEDGVEYRELGVYQLRNVYVKLAAPVRARYLRAVNLAASGNGCVVRDFSVNVVSPLDYGDGFALYDYVREGYDITHVSYACDGDPETFLDLEALPGGARTLTLDLGAPRTLQGLSLLSGGVWGDAIESCVVSCSSDGETYTELGAFTSDTGEYDLTFDAPAQARYVRVEVVNAGWITLRELSARTAPEAL